MKQVWQLCPATGILWPWQQTQQAQAEEEEAQTQTTRRGGRAGIAAGDRNSFIISNANVMMSKVSNCCIFEIPLRTHFALMCYAGGGKGRQGLRVSCSRVWFYNCNPVMWEAGQEAAAAACPLVEALLLLSPATATLMVRTKLVMIATSHFWPPARPPARQSAMPSVSQVQLTPDAGV